MDWTRLSEQLFETWRDFLGATPTPDFFKASAGQIPPFPPVWDPKLGPWSFANSQGWWQTPDTIDWGRFFGAALKSSPHLHAEPVETFAAWAKEYLELPQLGPGREWQSKLNNVMAAGIDAQTAAQRLTGHWSEVLHNTQRDFIASLSNEVGPAIETLAELNAQWTLAVEAQWRKRLLKEDYSRDFGEFVNAQARLKTALNDLFAELAQSFSQNGNEDIARLKASVDELRAELSDLADQRADKAGAVPPAPAVAKPQPAKTARRRRARKKTAANNSSAVKKPAERKKPSASRASSFDIDEL